MIKQDIYTELEVIHWQLSFAHNPAIIKQRQERLKELEQKLKELYEKKAT